MAGELNITETLNNDEFLRNLEKSNQALSSHTANVQRESSKIDDALSNIGKVAAGYFGIQAMQSFVSQLVNVRGEFQQLDVAFSTMLRSKEKANELMAQMVDTAAKTPYTLTEVATDAKQLLAFQVAQQDVNDTLIRLGNISSGVGVPLLRMVEIYGQVKAKGSLTGEEVRRFTEAGIPIIHELANVFGVADTQVSKLVESGKVGFPQVQQVIQNLTNKGGMFYNLMEQQSHTLTGELSNLHDAWDRMLNDMGSQNDGFLSGMILGATSAVDNYQEILDVIVPLIVAYGSYKVALLSVVALQKTRDILAYAEAFIETSKALGVATAAQTAMNAETKANVYVALASILIGLSVAIYEFATKTSQADKAHKELDSTIAGESLTLDILFDRLKNAKQGTDEYQKAKDAIIEKYSQYDSILNTELTTVNGITVAYNKLTQAVIDSAKARLKDKYTKDASDSAAEAIGNSYSEIRKKLQSKLGKDAGSALFESVKAAFDNGGDWEKLLNNKGISTEDTQSYSTGYGTSTYAVNDYSRLFNNISIEKDKLKESLQGFDDIFGDVQKKSDKSTVTTTKTIEKNKSFWEEQKKNAVNARDTLPDSEKGSTAWKTQSDLISEAERHLQAYSDKQKQVSKVPLFGTLEYWQKVLKALKDSITSYDAITGKAVGSKIGKDLKPVKGQSGIDITQDISRAQELVDNQTLKSFDEQMTYMKDQYDGYYQYIVQFGKDAADKQYSPLIAQGNSYTVFLENQQNKLKQIVSNGSATKEQIADYEKLTKALNDAKGIKDPFAQFQEDLSKLKDDSKTTADYLIKLSEAKKSVVSNANLTPEQKTQAIQLIDKEGTDASKKNLNDLLNKYKSVQQEMIDLQSQYDSDNIALTTDLVNTRTKKEKQAALDALQVRKNAYQKDVENLSESALQQTALYKQLFGNLTGVGEAKIHDLVSKAKDVLSSLTKNTSNDGTVSYSRTITTKGADGKDIEQTAVFSEQAVDGLKSKLQELQNTKAFDQLISDWKRFADDIESGDVVASLESGFGALADTMGAMQSSFGQVTNSLVQIGAISKDDADGMNQIFTDVQNIAQGASQLAQGIATGNPLAIVQGSISVISSGIDLIFGGKDRKIEKSIKEHQQAVKDLEVEYNELKKAVDKALGEDYLKDQASVINNLKLQKAELEQELALAESKSGKKKDQSQIDDIKSQLQTVSDSINDTIDAMSQKIMTTTGKDFASTLGSAIFDAVASGADAFDVIQEKSKDVVSNIVKQWLETKLLEKPLQEALDTLENKIVVKTNDGSVDKIAELQAKINELSKTNLSKSMFASQIKDYEDQIAKLQSSSTSSSWTELNLNTPEAQAALEEFKTNTQALGQDYASVLNQMNWLFDTSSSTNSTKGAIQGTSEETAGIIAGRLTNIILSNDRFATAQEEGLKVNRSMLITLNSIDTNTANTVSELKDMNNLLKTDSGLMRAKGLF